MFNLFAAVCGGNIDNPQGTIQSPKYPEWYPSNKKCTWTISLPEVCTTKMPGLFTVIVIAGIGHKLG